jgi:hypothetical protein
MCQIYQIVCGGCGSWYVVRISLAIHRKGIWVIGKRTIKNLIVQVDDKIKDYCATLTRLRQEFLAYATVTTEFVVLQTRDDVRKVDAQLTEAGT